MPAAAPAQKAPVSSGGPSLGEILKHTPMRRAIADHMVMYKQTSPHVTTVHEVDMSQVMAAYRKQKPVMAERGVKLTLTAFMIHALAETIREFPLVNSSLADEGLVVELDNTAMVRAYAHFVWGHEHAFGFDASNFGASERFAVGEPCTWAGQDGDHVLLDVGSAADHNGGFFLPVVDRADGKFFGVWVWLDFDNASDADGVSEEPEVVDFFNFVAY